METQDARRPMHVLHRVLDTILRETYGHEWSVQLLATGSIGLLIGCGLYFLSPLLEDELHLYERYLPWIDALDWTQYNSFVVDHLVVFSAISLPTFWLLAFNVAYSRTDTHVDTSLLILRLASCLVVSFSVTVILTDFLSRRVMLAIISLFYGGMGLMYAWTVPVWRWYMNHSNSDGLITFLPASARELLMETSLLEWLSGPQYFEKFQQIVPFLLPLSRSEQVQLLEKMPSETQAMMTKPGLVTLLPAPVQNVLLPSSPPKPLALEMETAKEVETDTTSSSSEEQLERTSSGFDFHRVETKRQQDLIAQSRERVLTDIVSKRLWTGCRQLVQFPSSSNLDRTAAFSSALLALQLYSSRSSRQALASTLRFISVSTLGSIATAALVLRICQWLVRTNHAPFQRYVHQLLLRSRSRNESLTHSSDEKDHRDTGISTGKSVTAVSAVVAVAYVIRKMRS